MVPTSRLRALNSRPDRPDRDFVLYWMVAARRTTHNPALEYAVELCRRHDKPLVVFEPLRIGYRWASARHHQFIMDGMVDNAIALQSAGVTSIRYVEPMEGAGSGLLECLARRSVQIVTDTWPCFFIPRMQAVAADRVDVRMEAVDGNGVLPLSATDRAYPTAASFRRHLQKNVLPHLTYRPADRPLDAYAQGPFDLGDLLAPWPSADVVDTLPIQQGIPPAPMRGGPNAGKVALARFASERLTDYGDRNHPDVGSASGLSPYLHYGHVGAQQVFWKVIDDTGWSPDDVGPKATGSRGWWGLPEAAEGFMDELVTWRELGAAFAHHRPDDYDKYGSIPDWARKTLDEHASDPRQLVSLEDLEAACSPDPIWNAAQRQLREQGIIHNYLRMLWGKKLLEWTEHPSVAFEWLTHLNNAYALDGRDPNSASGIAWVFGRHDRAWGPERPIFGKVRYMTSDSTRRKLKLKQWLARWG